MKHESKLCHIVTISKPFRRSNSPKLEIEDLISRCPLPIKKVIYNNTFIPISDYEKENLDKSGIQCLQYESRLCKAATQAQVYIEGEYSLQDIEEAMNNEQEHIRVYVDFFYEVP